MLSDSDLHAKRAQAWELVNELAPIAWREAFGEEYIMPEPAGRPFWEYFAAGFTESEYHHPGGNLGDVMYFLGMLFGIEKSGTNGYGGVLADYEQPPNEVQYAA